MVVGKSGLALNWLKGFRDCIDFHPLTSLCSDYAWLMTYAAIIQLYIIIIIIMSGLII